MQHSITNHKHFKDFTIIPNTILRDEEMTFYEKGLLSYLLSLPDNWEVNVGYIAEHFGDSERAILKGLKRLIEKGYCRRQPMRKNGRLAGQQYQITDIAFDFADPAKIEGAETSADPQLFSNAEISAPQKNGGSEENNNILEENISTSKEIDNSDGGTNDKKYCLFTESKFFDLEKFKAALAKESAAGIDVEYYYHSVADWSASKGEKRKNWISTARIFIRNDVDRKTLHMKEPERPYGAPRSVEEMTREEKLEVYSRMMSTLQ